MRILIGGAAGQGMDTIAHLLTRVLVREGYGVFSAKDYMSRVRGGHNFTVLRIDTHAPWSAVAGTDILLALNEETYHLHRGELDTEGKVIYDSGLFSLAAVDENSIPVNLQSLAKEAGGAIMANTVASGALLALIGLDTSIMEQLLGETFSNKPGVAEKNVAALRAGYAAAQTYCAPCFSLPPKQIKNRQLFLDGNQLLGMSALASGCRFLSAYPMTPATGIMTYLAGKQSSHDIIVEQAEDEIAAVNMALGASYAGVRALTSTSGGGFSLMVEGLSLAGMTETPLVIIVAMRPGPATGLPTRTEQGDLDFVLHAGHGEFPRAVLSATHLEDAFYRLNKAFELADRYQLPVLFLSDQNFADTSRSIPALDFSRLNFNRCLVDENNIISPYRRYRLSEDGISPRALPGFFPGEVVLADSDEHDEDGHIIEDGATRRLMVEKRLRKLEALALEMDEPELYGHDEPEIILTGWGSTYGVLREAVDLLSSEGHKAAQLHFSDIWPLPKVLAGRLLPRAKLSFCVENNATGQFAALLRREAGLTVNHSILKYDGRPFLPGEIVKEVHKHV
jgi:2-oxoglutarate/2-oxoacid ferredoxin oxidoreductase subunit alpha